MFEVESKKTGSSQRVPILTRLCARLFFRCRHPDIEPMCVGKKKPRQLKSNKMRNWDQYAYIQAEIEPNKAWVVQETTVRMKGFCAHSLMFKVCTFLNAQGQVL